MKLRALLPLLLCPALGLLVSGTLDGQMPKQVSSRAVTAPLPANVNLGSIVTFCDPANLNSTGFPTQLTAKFGSGLGSGLHFEMTQGPPFQLGYLLVGENFIDPGIPSGQGQLCLDIAGGSLIGRYNIPGTPMNGLGRFNSSGVFVNLVGTSSVGTGFDVPLTVPRIGGPIMAGQTLHFQMFHREPTGDFNLSNGVTVTF